MLVCSARFYTHAYPLCFRSTDLPTHGNINKARPVHKPTRSWRVLQGLDTCMQHATHQIGVPKMIKEDMMIQTELYQTGKLVNMFQGGSVGEALSAYCQACLITSTIYDMCAYAYSFALKPPLLPAIADHSWVEWASL